jgi:hypothetical protein
MKEIETIHIVGGINVDGEAFCTVSCVSSARDLLIGQLSPAEVRAMALGWLECAEAAEQDAATLQVLQGMELPDGLADHIVSELRRSREEP